jgi:hypothetical protein
VLKDKRVIEGERKGSEREREERERGERYQTVIATARKNSHTIN